MRKIKRVLRLGRVMRYRVYKKLGMIGHRRQLDTVFRIAFVAFLLFWIILLGITPKTPEIVVPEEQEAEVEIPNVIIPVSEQVNLYDKLKLLEQKAQLSEINLSRLVLDASHPLDTLLSKEKIDAEKRKQITDLFSEMIKLNTVRSGTVFYLLTDVEGQFLALILYLSNDDVMAVIQQDEELKSFQQTGHVKSTLERKEGKVVGSFKNSLKNADIPNKIISEIQNILQEAISIQNDIKKDDGFDVVMEQRVTAGGLELSEKRLRFVGVHLKKKDIYRYAFNEKGRISYYDPQGKTTPKALLKCPLQAKCRITSPFGNRRHPILMYNIFHKGVDYGAKMNTPIVAAMDGVIVKIGRNGGYGKYIQIKHAGGYQTAYGHMNNYKKGLAVGSHVKKNEVIGYVGNTGRSTGPHLHFEVIIGNKAVHPLQNHQIQGKMLTGNVLKEFQEQARQTHPDFDKHLFGKLPPVPPRRPLFATSLGASSDEVARNLSKIHTRVFNLRK